MAAFSYPTSLGTWIVLTMLSGIAIIMLPRQFHVTIVENRSEHELRTATWLFPLYLVAINLFVVPVAYAGILLVGDQTHADLYVLSLPLMHGHDMLAMFAFVGGLSAATAMVIVASVALSIMISNDLVMPLLVRRRLRQPEPRNRDDWAKVILNVRRAAIFLVLLAAFLYYRGTTGNTRLASIGLISFAAIAQFAPAFLGGLIWRGANSRGAVLGLSSGILGVVLHAAPALDRAGRPSHPDQRAVRAGGAEAAIPVRDRGRSPQSRRPVEPRDQHAALRLRLALALLRAARTHPGGAVRAARSQSDAQSEALPHRGDRQRDQGHDLALSRRGAHGALLRELCAAGGPAP
jgi:hypothetical protein